MKATTFKTPSYQRKAFRAYKQRLKDNGWKTLTRTLPAEVFDKVKQYSATLMEEYNSRSTDNQ